MSLIHSKYHSPLILSNKHLHTIIPALFFSSKFQYNRRERVELNDGDFIDLDWHTNDSTKLVLLLHGLEGDSDAFYVRDTAEQLVKNGYDIVAMNYRGCSGSPNRLLKSYHSGGSHDVREIINQINTKHKYDKLYIAGFSLGGAILLKYLGEAPKKVATNFVKGIAFSAPLNLGDAGIQIGKTFFGLYEKRFMNRLKDKLRTKLKQFPNDLNENTFKLFKTFAEFDNYHTAPTNGFSDANDYYTKASAKQYLKTIQHSALLVSALDDPFLPQSCYPFEEAKDHPYFSFEAPQKGGHLSFVTSILKQKTHIPQRIIDYFESK